MLHEMRAARAGNYVDSRRRRIARRARISVARDAAARQ